MFDHDHKFTNSYADRSAAIVSHTWYTKNLPLIVSTSIRGLTGGRLGGVIGGVLAIFVLVFCISSHWIYSRLQKRREKDRADLPHHLSSGGSQAPTLVQSSHLVSPPPSESLPTAAPVPNLEAPLPPHNSLPGHNIHSSARPLPSTPSASSQLPQSTKVLDQQVQPETRTDNRSNKSKVVINFTSRH